MHVKHLLLALTVFSASLSPAFCPTPAAAQQAPAPSAPLPCTGNVNIVRVSEIKPGMMSKFLQAAAAQQDWYKNAGTPDKIHVMRVMEQDPTTKAYTLSETQALTTHSMPATRAKDPAHDAGFDAFVTLFKDSSTIKTTYMTCVAQ
jgi:hypothetical protein